MRDALWRCHLTSVPIRHSESSAIEALLDALDGVIGSFYVYNPKKPYPLRDPQGNILGVAPWIAQVDTHTTDTIVIKNLPPGYVVSAGDFFQIDYGNPSKRHLFRAVNGGIADNTFKTPPIKVRPFIPGTIPRHQLINFYKPSAEMALVPNSVRTTQLDVLYDVIEFEAIQVFQ